jgi:hypothetical protein
MKNNFCHLSGGGGAVGLKISWKSSQGIAYCCTFQREIQVFTMGFPCSSSNLNKHEMPRPTIRKKNSTQRNIYRFLAVSLTKKKHETKPTYYTRHKYASNKMQCFRQYQRYQSVFVYPPLPECHLQTTIVMLSPSSCVSRIFKFTTCIFSEIVIANISQQL